MKPRKKDIDRELDQIEKAIVKKLSKLEHNEKHVVALCAAWQTLAWVTGRPYTNSPYRWLRDHYP